MNIPDEIYKRYTDEINDLNNKEIEVLLGEYYNSKNYTNLLPEEINKAVLEQMILDMR